MPRQIEIDQTNPRKVEQKAEKKVGGKHLRNSRVLKRE